MKYVFGLMFFVAGMACSQSQFAGHDRWMIFGGVSQPIGDFGTSVPAHSNSSFHGYANTGVTLGGAYFSEVAKNFEVGGNFSFSDHGLNDDAVGAYTGDPNQLDTSPWLLFDFLGAAGFVSQASKNVAACGHVYLGLMAGESASGAAQYEALPSTWAAAVEYGVGFGLIIESKYEVGFRFLTSDPTYSPTLSFGNTGSESFSVSQSTSRLQLTFGIDL